jgi:hypothetical protein
VSRTFVLEVCFGSYNENQTLWKVSKGSCSVFAKHVYRKVRSSNLLLSASGFDSFLRIPIKLDCIRLKSEGLLKTATNDGVYSSGEEVSLIY